MISVLPDLPFLVNFKLQECNAGIMGVDGHVGRPGVDICTFARGLTLSYHNVVWQGDQCLIFHTVLPY